MRQRQPIRIATSLRRRRSEGGTASVELALILPLIILILFAIVDFGRLIDTRLVMIKLAQQGATLGYRNLDYPTTTAELLALLQRTGNTALDVSEGSAQDFNNAGKIFFWKINGGSPPTIVNAMTGQVGNLAGVTGTINATATYLGLSQQVYNRLASSEIGAVVVVEVFYRFRPFTPISNLIPGLLTRDSGGFTVSSRAVFAANST